MSGGDRPGAFAGRNKVLNALLLPRSRPLVIAHRGDSSHAPENTLEAAWAGWEAGADAWELDVQLTRNGVPVVIHDESLLRTTNVAERFAHDVRGVAGYRVSDFDYEEIRTLDAGSWFLDAMMPRGTGQDSFGDGEVQPAILGALRSGMIRVPHLEECLEFTKRLGWLVNVELKSLPNRDPRLLGAVTGVIESLDVGDRVLLSSFDHEELARAVSIDLPWATGVLTEPPLYRPEHYVREVVGADCYHVSALALGAGSHVYRCDPGPQRLAAAELERLNAAGIPAIAYTLNDTRPDGLAVHLACAGVSGFFTDRPRDLRHRLEKSDLSPSWPRLGSTRSLGGKG